MAANSAVQDVGGGIVFSLKFTMYFFCWPSLQCTFFVGQVYNVLSVHFGRDCSAGMRLTRRIENSGTEAC